MDDYRAGKTDGCTIDDYIEEWHALSTPVPPLREYLGMSWAEFKDWYYTATLPERGAP